jgi:hypothetical protein
MILGGVANYQFSLFDFSNLCVKVWLCFKNGYAGIVPRLIASGNVILKMWWCVKVCFTLWVHIQYNIYQVQFVTCILFWKYVQGGYSASNQTSSKSLDNTKKDGRVEDYKLGVFFLNFVCFWWWFWFLHFNAGLVSLLSNLYSLYI